MSRIDNLKNDIFEEYDTDELPKDAKEIWSNYEYSSYEGSGHLIGITDKNQWFHHDCGHCSCYGPLERFEDQRFDSLELLLNNCSKALDEELQEIIDMIPIETRNLKAN